MRNIFLFIASFLPLLGSAQQETFEFFKWNKVTNPLTFNYDKANSDNSPETNIDSKGNRWIYSYPPPANKAMIYSLKDTIIIPIPTGLNLSLKYSISRINIGERDTKWLLFDGIYTNGYVYDYFGVRVDSNNQITYIFPKGNQPTDTLNTYEGWKSFYGVNDRSLVNGSRNFYWGISPTSIIPYTSIESNYSPNSIFSDQKGTLYCISYNNVVVSFHADGTYKRRLPNINIRKYSFNPSTGTLTVFGNEGIFEMNGVTDSNITPANYLPIALNATSIQTYLTKNGNSSYSGFVTDKGFVVNEGNKSIQLFFSKVSETGADSLSLTYYYNQLQDDSTLLFAFKNSDTKIFLFTYKNGIAKWDRTVNWSDYGQQYAPTSSAYYLGKTHNYYYGYYYDRILQVIDNKLTTTIPFQSNTCELYGKVQQLRIDKDFLWFDNQPYTKDTIAQCAIARMSHDTYFYRGKVFYDANVNGYNDMNEMGYSNIKLLAQPSGLLLTPTFNGEYAFKINPGETHTISVADSIRFSSIKYYQTSIGVKLKEEKPEVVSSFVIPSARCASNTQTRVTLRNNGSVPIEKIIIRVFGDQMQLQQDGNLVDTVRFTYAGLGIGGTTYMSYNILWPEARQIGQTATLRVITSLYNNNSLVQNTIDSMQTIIRCSYDPNDKSATPVGLGTENLVKMDQALTYVIRFENTGNDIAYHVAIFDTLSNELDYTTFKVLGSSHKVNTELTTKGQVAFHFNNIMLPDSTTNKFEAQGYVQFSVRPKSKVSEYTVICNQASIIFDKNPAIVTNSTCRKLVSKPLITEVIEEKETSELIFPNPCRNTVTIPKEAELYTVINASGFQVAHGSAHQLDVSQYAEGLYMVLLQFPDGWQTTQKLIVIK